MGESFTEYSWIQDNEADLHWMESHKADFHGMESPPQNTEFRENYNNLSD